jgi:hypothetical protein
MRSKVAAAIALSVAMAATTASAGVVISEDVVVSNQAGTHTTKQTVLIQGNRQKVLGGDRIFITDLDAPKISVLNPAHKTYGDLPIPPSGVVQAIMAKDGISVELKKQAGTHKVAGYDCQDYAGTQRLGHYNLEVTECIASAAPGAKEFVEYTKAMAARLKGAAIEPKGEVPDGIPVSSTVTTTVIPYPIPKNFPPNLTAQVKAEQAKAKPEVKRTTVTKIEVKEIAADEFLVPADYPKPKPKTEFKQGVPGGPNPPIPAPEQPIPPGVMPPSPPAAH